MTSSPRITIDKMCRYPFLEAAKEWMRKQDISPLDAFYEHDDMLEIIRGLFDEALSNVEVSTVLKHDNEEILFIYPWLKILLSFLGMPKVVYKMANLLSKHFGSKLDEEKYPDDLVNICHDQGLKVQLLAEGNTLQIRTVLLPFRMYFTDFLPVAVSFKSPAWKLVNRVIKNGYVYLKKHDLARILEERVKQEIIEVMDWEQNQELLDRIMADPLIKPFFEELKAKCKEKVKQFKQWDDNIPVNTAAFPPCINAILEKNMNGQNLAHSERLFLTYFMLTIGQSVDEVLELFKQQPDYNEKIARYQVEFAAGMHGKKTKYKPHNCAKLASLNMCMKDHPKFTNKECTNPRFEFKNPLTIYRRIVRHQEYTQRMEGGTGETGEGDGKKENGRISH